MTTIINANTSAGLTQTADTSGILKVQSNGVTTNALAWVNFNGVTTTSIRASFNVSSVTRNSTGDYTINFTTALSDANFVVCGTAGGSGYLMNTYDVGTARTTSLVRVTTFPVSGSSTDVTQGNVAIFGN